MVGRALGTFSCQRFVWQPVNVTVFVPLGGVDPAARVISLGPVSDVVDSGVLQQLNESSGHISACRSRELRI